MSAAREIRGNLELARRKELRSVDCTSSFSQSQAGLSLTNQSQANQSMRPGGEREQLLGKAQSVFAQSYREFCPVFRIRIDFVCC
jgi:hypothetical protein